MKKQKKKPTPTPAPAAIPRPRGKTFEETTLHDVIGVDERTLDPREADRLQERLHREGYI